MKHFFLLFLLFLSTSVFAQIAPKVCPYREDGSFFTSDCYCPEGQIELKEGLCFAPEDTDPVISHRDCGNYDAYPSWSGEINCFLPCRPMHKRVYDEDGFAVNICMSACPPPLSLFEDEGVCKMFCPDQDIIGQACYKKCLPNQIRDSVTHYCKDLEPEPEPEPEKNCKNDLLESIKCFHNDVNSSINKFDLNFSSKLSDLNDLFSSLLNKISNKNNQDIEDNQDTENDDLDLDSMKADVSFRHLDENVLNRNIFNSSSQCPKSNTLHILNFTYSFDYERICYWLAFLGNLVLIISLILATNIVSKS